MKWIEIECSDGKFYVCENCGHRANEKPIYDRFGYFVENSPILTPFCPICGEKLEKE